MPDLVRKTLLAPFSFLYGVAVWVRNKLYDWQIFKTHAPGVPIISVGNLSVGGTGKTPMTEYLLRYLLAHRVNPAYLSRGYGRKTKGYIRLDAAQHNAQQVGDEALQVARKFPAIPVAVCENRVAGVHQLLQGNDIGCVILDDAFQHRRIGRQLDVVMIDANRLPWKDALLPAGTLREPYRNLGRANLVVVNKVRNLGAIPYIKQRLHKHGHQVCFAQLKPQRLVSFGGIDVIGLDQLKNRNCIVFSGLGNNEVFYEDVRAAGLKIVKKYPFTDHHVFTEKEIKTITRHYRYLTNQDVFEAQPVIITTEKDFNRLKDAKWFQLQASQLPFYYLEVALEIIEGKEIFEGFLQTLVDTHAGRRSATV
jgi:tetraacyldisaccharide 4'-kinase